jgi:hypothetical protein
MRSSARLAELFAVAINPAPLIRLFCLRAEPTIRRANPALLIIITIFCNAELIP